MNRRHFLQTAAVAPAALLAACYEKPAAPKAESKTIVWPPNLKWEGGNVPQPTEYFTLVIQKNGDVMYARRVA